MLYCEIFNVSHTFGDRTSSSVIGIVLRYLPLERRH